MRLSPKGRHHTKRLEQARINRAVNKIVEASNQRLLERGRQEGRKQTQEEIDTQAGIEHRKACLDLARSLGQLVEATAKAVIALTENVAIFRKEV